MRYKKDEHAAGASSARNKLASFLRDHGIDIPEREYPPDDIDFLRCIYTWAHSRGAKVPELDRIMELEKQAEAANQELIRQFSTNF